MRKFLTQTGRWFLFVLTAGLLGAGSFTVQAAEDAASEPVEYINRYYDKEKGAVISESEVCEDYTVITSDMTTLSNGWYVVKDDVSISSADVEIRGDVRVIIEDGKQWALYNHSIHVTGSNKFTLYAGTEQTGKLFIVKSYNDDGNASIGGTKADTVENGESCGTITFNGGNLSVMRGYGGTAIGTGRYGTGGRIVINAGTLSCLSDPNPLNGANIGSGADGSGVEIEMNGGKVTVKGNVSVADSGYTLFGRPTDKVTMNGGFVATSLWTTGTKKVNLISSSFTYNSGVLQNEYNRIVTAKNIKEDVTVPGKYIMTVAEDEILTIPEGVQFVNNGTVLCYGKLINHGNIENNGTLKINEQITGTGTYTGTDALVAKNVTIRADEHVTVVSGELFQRVMPGEAMEEVVLAVEKGYELAKGDVTQEYQGIQVTKEHLQKIVISGKLSEDVTEDLEIALPKIHQSTKGAELSIRIDTVQAGEPLPDVAQVAVNAGTVTDIRYYVEGEEISGAVSDGYEYEVKMIIEPEEGTEFSALTTAQINDSEAKVIINAKDGTAQITGTLPATTKHGAFYIDRTYDAAVKKVISELKECSGFRRMVGDTWTDGWYFVTQDTTLSHVTVNGDVRLILADGVTLNVNDSIDVGTGASLSIYGQKQQTGTLNVRNADRANYPAIGNAYNTGEIVINGGIVNARTYESSYAGIGAAGAKITINGGRVLSSSAYGYDIRGDKVTINGGDITTQNKGINATIEQNGGIYTDTGNHKVSAASELLRDVEIAEGSALTVPEGVVLTIPAGITLKNSGELTVFGAVDNQGTWINNGTVRIRAKEQLSGNDITDNGSGQYIQFMSADEIVVPEGLTYTGEDQTEAVKAVITLKPEQTEGIVVSGQTFTKDNDTSGWTYVLKKRGNVIETVKEEGTYTVVYSKDGIVLTKDFAIGRFELTKEMMSGIETSYYYTGKEIMPVPVITSYDGTVFENGWDYQVTYENNIEPGTATMTVKGTTSCMGEFSTTFSIQYLDMPEVTINAAEGKEGYYVSDVRLSSEGYQIAEVPSEDTAVKKLEWKEALTYTEDGDYTKVIRFKNKAGAVTDQKKVTFKLDQMAPEVTIRIGAKDYRNTLQDEIAFLHYRSDRNEVTIDCEDQASQTASVEYLLSQENLKDLESAGEKYTWQIYDEKQKPSLTSDTDQIVYVRAADYAGNVTYVRTDGIYIDTMAPKVTELSILTGADALKETELTFSFRTDEAGSYFYAVFLADANAPDADTIIEMVPKSDDENSKNKTTASGAAAYGMGTVTKEDVTEGKTALVTERVMGLAADTAYRVYVVMQDDIYDISKTAEGQLVHNRSDVVESDIQRTAKSMPQDDGTKPGNTTDNRTTDEKTTTDNGNPTDTRPSELDKRYRITGASTAEYVRPALTDQKKVVIADTIEYNGKAYKVTSVAKNAFKNNKRVTEVVAGKYVTTIKDQAFANAKVLKKVTLGKNTTKFGSNVFKGSKKLKTITIKSAKLKKSSLKKSSFKGITSKTTVKVPKKKQKSYKKLLKAAGLGKKVKVK